MGIEKIKKSHMLQFKQNGDERGKLVVVEGNKDISFEIKRIFYIYGTKKDVIRGQHANIKTEFVLINVSGTSKILVDDGVTKQVFTLDKPHIGIYIPNMVWKDMYDFSEDSILLVLASEEFDSKEYIRDYDEYIKLTQKLYENV